ncbi:DUF6431 domain-containing protein [Sporolactobacillus laevolacticus]|uniref:DUF6431 domain-containing protein n=1 Tax=Sporolactobacillus laevolacticus TaxID=33018 RepID=UPI001F462E53|nr:DUF6431 domain-containing protein [Sporolactobacillus laevolacticus]
MPCPCCGGELKVIGSRLRKYIEDSGKCVSLRIRRLCCGTCSKIHHELPDLLLPYKRYESCCFEKAISQPNKNDVATDNSTLFRWNRWFLEFIDYWLACLHSIALRFQQMDLAPVAPSSVESLTLSCLNLNHGKVTPIILMTKSKILYFLSYPAKKAWSSSYEPLHALLLTIYCKLPLFYLR